MKYFNTYRRYCLAGLVLATATLSSCEKDGNPNELAETNPADYVGTVGGYRSSDEIIGNSLVAYFPFDGNATETKSNSVPTAAVNATYVAGVKGQAVSLNAGYLYYAKQFDAFKTSVFKSFTIIQWVKISNNGSKRTQLLQLARPGRADLVGNIDLNVNTQARAASALGITFQNYFQTATSGRQDNVNQNVLPNGGPNNWLHYIVSYNGLTGRFSIIVNGVELGTYSDRGTGASLFFAHEPTELIIGGNYSSIPGGKTTSTDTSYAPMTGQIDDLKITNAFMPAGVAKAYYELIMANK